MGGYFYPRSPCGERHTMTTTICIVSKFLSTLSLRRATGYTVNFHAKAGISIHALLAESDVSFMLYDTSSLIFLSTLSLRRATVAPVLAVGRAGYFYPRSPCGERHILCVVGVQVGGFLSTLSLRRATQNYECFEWIKEFLSTLSLRRATTL